ncbi:nucleoside triphosphate pyrophosphohydrolase [Alicyclobacillus sp. ALC3]|uniref:nucleoside triphosphate pyrophosphohydrolase n=1 Tax=Alicyclobacillus sp. ALC3 TaxID=2796143 RepID=UPI0023797D0A|nr:nucleoside triphosphate pyrophosphohydrolase [Alicyclobacillus sp. ALC3]WDL98988.1 nucleoside triphosphate pyrophosphohydrolase [Alicyclobacillus sp. ALC3]
MPTIHVVGLGPGDLDSLPVSTYRLLQSGMPVYLRTAVHPVVPQLRELGVKFESFDAFYESESTFEHVYRSIAKALTEAAQRRGEVLYAVPGHPLMAEQSVQNLLADAHVEVKIGPGQSFLDPVCTALSLDPINGLVLLDGTSLRAAQLAPDIPTLVAQVFGRAVATEVKLTLMDVYPDEHLVTVVRAAGVTGQERILEVPLYQLDHLDWLDHLTTLYVPPCEAALARDPVMLAELVARLRAPGGCPWDRKQTHQSLRPYVIEEAYEVAHAIDEGDDQALADELGDLFLQVLLHAQIGSEEGLFTLGDVYERLGNKLIRRHPHVFGEEKARTVEEAQAIWSAQKQTEGGEELGAEASWLAGLRWGRPAAQVAMDLQERAAKLGFDWPDLTGVVTKLREELTEFEDAQREGEGRMSEELGDILFTVVNLARWLSLDPEQVLAATNQKFVRRFNYVVERAVNDMDKSDITHLERLERYWQEAKIATESDF